VILVLDDVAVPDEETGAIERRPDARDLARVGDDRVLAGACLPSLGATHCTGRDILSVHDLEQDLVDVDRVRVGGEVVQLPDFGRTDGGILRDRVVPAAGNADTCCERAEQRLLGPERFSVQAVETTLPSDSLTRTVLESSSLSET
jgi:hypothetical protein